MVAEEARDDHGRARLPHDQRNGRPHRTCCTPTTAIKHWKADGLDLSAHSHADSRPARADRGVLQPQKQDHGLEPRHRTTSSIEHGARPRSSAARRSRSSCRSSTPTARSARCSATTASSKSWGRAGLPDDTIHIKFHGSAGQSFGAFLAKGVSIELEGDANDYVGKGSPAAASSSIRRKESTFAAEENILIGNVVLYGATERRGFFRGRPPSASACATAARGRHRRRWRPRLRIHDRRPRGDPRAHRPQLRGRHVAAASPMSGTATATFYRNATWAPSNSRKSIGRRGIDEIKEMIAAPREYTGSTRRRSRCSTTGEAFAQANSSKSCRPTTNACCESARQPTARGDGPESASARDRGSELARDRGREAAPTGDRYHRATSQEPD